MILQHFDAVTNMKFNWDPRNVDNKIQAQDGTEIAVYCPISPKIWQKTTNKFRMALFLASIEHWKEENGYVKSH